MGGKVTEIYEVVIYSENFKVPPFRKLFDKLFNLKKHKEEGNDLVQGLVKLFMNGLYRIQIRIDINEFCKSKSEHWMQTEYDDNVSNYWKPPN